MPKFRIVVLGIGGVGGYYGGKLAAWYKDPAECEVIFIARGMNKTTIASRGLSLTVSGENEIVRPSLVTSRPEEVGQADLVVCCVKSYDLEAAMEDLRPCIDGRTVILPLLNGTDAAQRIKVLFPEALVCEGCAYIIARLVEPGVVNVSGTANRMLFGESAGSSGDIVAKDTLRKIESIFGMAGIQAESSGNIEQEIWEKFLFISPFATLTSWLDCPIGDILSNPQHKEKLLRLLGELKEVADGKGIGLPDHIVQKVLDKMNALPAEASSSMHNDFKMGKRTELDSLVAYVVRLGKTLNIPTPLYGQILEGLKKRSPD